jgi:hypothetical protein
MRLEALLLAAGLAVATAGTAAANPNPNPCETKTWLAETLCEMTQKAERAQQAERERDGVSFVRALLQPPRTMWDWVRDLAAQSDSSTMISSSERPSTSPAATAPSDAVSRKDGRSAGTRSP